MRETLVGMVGTAAAPEELITPSNRALDEMRQALASMSPQERLAWAIDAHNTISR